MGARTSARLSDAAARVAAAAAAIVAAGVVLSGLQSPPDPDALVARAAAYVADYQARLSSVVAEERYEQRLRVLTGPAAGVLGPTRGSTSAERRRTLVSDYLLVWVPSLDAWMPFRDVIELNGKPVRDRDQRLARLFLELPSDAMDQAGLIAEESARFNLGNVQRNVNVPTLALVFLTDRHRHRLTFQLDGEEKIDGVRTTRLGYKETVRPTLIHGADDADMVADGAFWVEPDTGRLVQTRLHIRGVTLESEIVVTYRPDKRMDLWVPGRMKESYKSETERFEGTATYSNFRRFQVQTDQIIKK
jgi:hypothetical protein